MPTVAEFRRSLAHPDRAAPVRAVPALEVRADAGYQGEPGPMVQVTGPTSLDSQETSEKTDKTSIRVDFDAFMSRKGTDEHFRIEAGLDQASLSANFRHSGWRNVRERVYKSFERTGQTQGRRASFGSCGSYSWIEQSQTNPGLFRLRANTCKDRLCTPCANERSRRMRDGVLGLIEDRPVTFITLTLAGKGESLATLLDRLYKHFKALRQLDLWKDNVGGGVAFLEVKWSDKAQRWHPHLHVLADVKWIPHDELTKAWHLITHDSFIVDIRRVRDQPVMAGYVTKYASKPLNPSFSNTPKLLDEAVVALKGRRLGFAFGSWYHNPIFRDDFDGDDQLDLIQANFKIYADLESVMLDACKGDGKAIAILASLNLENRWRALLTPC
jgi:hypothetical protein